MDLMHVYHFHCPVVEYLVMIFVYASHDKKDILMFGKGPTDGLDDYWISEYSFNFTEQKNYLSLYYNGSNGFLCVNGAKIYKLKAKE